MAGKKKVCNIVGSLLEVCATVNEEIKLHGKITMINEMHKICVIRVVCAGAAAAARTQTRFFFNCLCILYFLHYRNIYLVVNNRR